jgi:hypothetical protein
MLRTFGLVLLVGSVVAAAPSDYTLRSPGLAKQVTTALAKQHLDAIAASYPDEPDRFVAALFFPDAQLLVVSARYSSPQLLQARLSQKQYRDVYLDLQGAPVPDSSWFFQDMNADGLCTGRDQAADAWYRGTAAPVIFDGSWKKHNQSEQEYQERLREADDHYSRMLEVLLTSLHGT